MTFDDILADLIRKSLVRGILGVVDRFSPKGVEDEGEIRLAEGLPAEDRVQAVIEVRHWPTQPCTITLS